MTRRVTLSGVLALVVCLLVVGWIWTGTEVQRTRWYHGQGGETVVTPDFSATVTDVHVARSVATSWGEETQPDGVFVVVDWTVDVTRSRLFFAHVHLATADGKRFLTRNEFQNASAEAGFTTTGSSVFDVHPDDVEGAVLEIRGSRTEVISRFTVTRSGGLDVTGESVQPVEGAIMFAVELQQEVLAPPADEAELRCTFLLGHEGRTWEQDNMAAGALFEGPHDCHATNLGEPSPRVMSEPSTPCVRFRRTC